MPDQDRPERLIEQRGKGVLDLGPGLGGRLLDQPRRRSGGVAVPEPDETPVPAHEPRSIDALDWQLVESIFHEAADLSVREQSGIIEARCSGKPWVRERVLEMIRADQRSTLSKLDRIEEDAGGLREGLDAAHAPAPPPPRVGALEVRVKLSHCPFFDTYAARDPTPASPHTSAAVTVFRGIADPRALQAWFEASHQQLRALRGPGIAGYLWSELLGDGRACVVLEAHGGFSVTEYCDDARTPFFERIGLAREVCLAVQRVHDAGLVHGDVCGQRVHARFTGNAVTLSLWGVGFAAALRGAVRSEALAPAGALVGDCASIAPEQARRDGCNADRPSDVYGLGVLLQELATGTTGISRRELEALSPREALAIVGSARGPGVLELLEKDRGRARILASSRRLRGARALIRAVRGDLEAVIAKATAPDPESRYMTARALAEDIERFVRGRPVAARGDALWYRVRHAAEKHPALATILLLLLGLVVAYGTWYAFYANPRGTVR